MIKYRLHHAWWMHCSNWRPAKACALSYAVWDASIVLAKYLEKVIPPLVDLQKIQREAATRVIDHVAGMWGEGAHARRVVNWGHCNAERTQWRFRATQGERQERHRARRRHGPGGHRSGTAR